MKLIRCYTKYTRELFHPGSNVGSIGFADYDSVKSITVVDGNRYFGYNFTADQFYVTSRIDIDEGLEAIQAMNFRCLPKIGPPLEVWVGHGDGYGC